MSKKDCCTNINYEGMVTKNKHGRQFTDLEVAKYVKKHLRIRDCFSVKKVSLASMLAFDIFLGEAKMESKKKNWKFFTKDANFVWIEES